MGKRVRCIKAEELLFAALDFPYIRRIQDFVVNTHIRDLTGEICERLRFSNHDTAQILALVDNHMRFGHATRMNQSTLKKFLRMPGFDEHLALHRADSLASHRNLSTYEFIQKKIAEIPPEKIRPKPLVTGDDLIAAGYAAGPKFREMLDAVEDAQLEGRLLTHDAALEFVKREFPL